MFFEEFAEYLNRIENTSGRTDMTVILSEMMGKLENDEIKYVMYLIQGRLVPKYIDLEFNISGKLILRALESLVSKNKSEILAISTTPKVKGIYLRLGDVGSTAEELVKELGNELIEKTILTQQLSVLEVYQKLKDIAESSGKGSQEDKMNKYLNLISLLNPQSVKYLTRIIIGTIRLGISDKTILDSLSWHKSGDKSLRKDLDVAFGARADVGELAEIVINSKSNEIKQEIRDNNFNTKELSLHELLNEIKVKPGTPIASKLVEREASSEAVWERMPDCFVQPKLDGLRGQIHFQKYSENMSDKDKLLITSTKQKLENTLNDEFLVAVYSRNMENMTAQYPELIKSVKDLNVDSIILDSEIIGFNAKETKYMSYQDTMKRRRKYDVDEYAKSIPVKAMCFDILYLNGEDLTQRPIEERLKLLKEILNKKGADSSFELLETKQITSDTELEEYFKSKVENGLEGIIAKEKESIYEPGTRNFKWIKLKANTRSDLVDTIDVAVLGYYIGRGDRSRFGFGALLAGVHNAEDDKYYSIGKVGSGFKEEEMPEMLKDMLLAKNNDNTMPENYIVEKSLIPDIWINPKIVMEIDADEITRSPNHTTARGIKSSVKNDDFTKGLSVRFPRMKKWKRDKDLPNSVQEIIRMYELRKMK